MKSEHPRIPKVAKLAIGGAGWLERRQIANRRPHWLALAAKAVNFTQKSRAAAIQSRNAMIRNS